MDTGFTRQPALRVCQVAKALLACGVLGVVLGGATGAAYAVAWGCLPQGVCWGLVSGAVSGFPAGVVGGTLGGRTGWACGGFFGGVAASAMVFPGWPVEWWTITGCVGLVAGYSTGAAVDAQRSPWALLRDLRFLVAESGMDRWSLWQRLALAIAEAVAGWRLVPVMRFHLRHW